MGMLKSSEFFNVLTTDLDAQKAREILKSKGVDFTIYSFDENTKNEILKHGDVKEELLADIKKANESQTYIGDIVYKRQEGNKKEENINLFFDKFETAGLSKRRLFVIAGETGVGKTYLINNKYPDMVTYKCNSALDPYSLCYFLADKGNGFQPYETPFLRTLRNGGRVFLDEFNELPRDTKMFIQGITDESPTVVVGDEEITIGEGFKIITTMNPNKETDEREPIGDALAGRAVGIILTLDDETLSFRLSVSRAWLGAVRRLYNYIAKSMYDARDLDFRDYQKIKEFGIEQLKFKFCMHAYENIAAYASIENTDEYVRMCREIKDNE